MKTKGLTVTLTLGLGLLLVLVWLVSDRLPVAHAASITVDVFNDENDGSCASLDCSLREAIILANGTVQPDTINLGIGIYLLSIAGTEEDDAATGDLDISEEVTIIGLGPSLTWIDADEIDRVFDISGTVTVVISGVTIMDGSVDGRGGGIDVGDAHLILYNTHVVGNTSIDVTTSYGGGLYVDAGSVTMDGGKIRDNFADGTLALGGGLYVGSGQATIDGAYIAGNSIDGTGAYGAGVYVGSGNATISQTHILDNDSQGTGAHGGGLYVDSGSATLSASFISDNTTSGTTEYGGGLHVDDGRVTLNTTQIFSNTAERGGGLYVGSGSATLYGGQVYSCTADDGGGVYVSTGGAVLSGTAVISNTAGEGGGIRNNGGVTLTNVTLSHNRATTDEGGGLFNTGDGSALLTFVTVAFNGAAAGGNGIHSELGGVVRVKNTLVAANGPANCSPGILSDGWNLDSGNTCGFTKPSDQRNTNPKLGPLQDNGGATLTHALLPGSRAIDAGQCLLSIPQDQRGRSRPNPGSSFCDIGAYEARDAGFTNLILTKRVTPASAAPGDPVTYTIEFSHTGPSGAVKVIITDSVPVSVTGVIFTNTGATITPLPGTPYVWRVQDLLPRAGGIITISGVLSVPLATGTFTNEAVIASTAFESSAADNRGKAALTVLNVAPVAQDDSYNTPHDTLLSVAAPGVLDNDSDANGDSPQALLEGDVASGTLSLDADGSFTYTPDTGFDGTDSFTYRASDGSLTSDLATVSILVGSASNQAPVADAGEDQSVDASVLVTLDGSGSTDPDGHLPLIYGWTQTGGPAVVLSDSGAISPTFTAPASSAELTFTLVVTDTLGLASAPDAVVVTVGTYRVYLPLVLRDP